MNATNPPASPPTDLLPIRAVAAETGISAATLRIWERRYGRPVPVRLPSGHRRYTQEQVIWLRRVAEALARGHRAAGAVTASPEQLEAMLGVEEATDPPRSEVQDLLDCVRRFDEAGVVRVLDQSSRELPALEFIDAVLVPLLVAVGRAWADGKLQVRHEHFVSSLVDDALRHLRNRLVVRPRGAPMLLATLPGELHGLGLRMAAVLCDLAGVPVTHLGVDTPIGEIADGARETGAFAVVLAVSRASAGLSTDAELSALRARVPEGVHLLVGGATARRARTGPRGIVYVENFTALDRWLSAQRQESTRANTER